MDDLHAIEWIDLCSKRLQQHWRTVDPHELDEVAIDLWTDRCWRAMAPELAAEEWLRLGVLAAA